MHLGLVCKYMKCLFDIIAKILTHMHKRKELDMSTSQAVISLYISLVENLQTHMFLSLIIKYILYAIIKYLLCMRQFFFICFLFVFLKRYPKDIQFLLAAI
ncbi:hypothetical protein ACJX0J_027797, partial [Zea mays]